MQDIPTQVTAALQHYGRGLAPTLLHTVNVEEDTLLARLLGTASLPVNSFHHQAVKELGKGLRVNCRARDGVIEGVECCEGRPILGVQFHPEESAAHYPRFQTFFDWLVHEAAAFRE